MGIDINRFVSTIPDDLICHFCDNVLDNPVRWPANEQLFCLDCITQWLQNNSSCQLDMEELLTTQLKPAHVTANLIEDYSVKCEFAGHGCQVVMKLGLIKGHRDDCEFDYAAVAARKDLVINKYKDEMAKLQMLLKNGEHNSDEQSEPSGQMNSDQKKDEEIRKLQMRVDEMQKEHFAGLEYRDETIRKFKEKLYVTQREFDNFRTLLEDEHSSVRIADDENDDDDDDDGDDDDDVFTDLSNELDGSVTEDTRAEVAYGLTATVGWASSLQSAFWDNVRQYLD